MAEQGNFHHSDEGDEEEEEEEEIDQTVKQIQSKDKSISESIATGLQGCEGRCTIRH